MISVWILTVETCDERTIPAVSNATYTLHRSMFYPNGTAVPPSLLHEFYVPKYVNVSYACDEGYRLKYPYKHVIGCQYVRMSREGQQNLPDKAKWTSADGIGCEKSEWTIQWTYIVVG